MLVHNLCGNARNVNLLVQQTACQTQAPKLLSVRIWSVAIILIYELRTASFIPNEDVKKPQFHQGMVNTSTCKSVYLA